MRYLIHWLRHLLDPKHGYSHATQYGVCCHSESTMSCKCGREFGFYMERKERS